MMIQIPYNGVPDQVMQTAALSYAAWRASPAAENSIDLRILELYLKYTNQAGLTPEQEDKLWHRYMRLKCRLIETLKSTLSEQLTAENVQAETEELLFTLYLNPPAATTGKVVSGSGHYTYFQHTDESQRNLYVFFLSKLPCATDTVKAIEKRSVRIALLPKELKLCVVRTASLDSCALRINLEWHRQLKDEPHVVKLKHHIELPHQHEMHHCFKYYDLGDLSGLIDILATMPKLRWQVVRTILKQVAFLHAKDIVHRDLKLENIVLKRGKREVEVALIDFELACALTETDEKFRLQYCGSLANAAPELLSACFHSHKLELNPSVDMWAIGIICLELFSKQLPYALIAWIEAGQLLLDAKRVRQAVEKLQDNACYSRLASVCNDALSYFVWRLLDPNPHREQKNGRMRLTSAEALAYFEKYIPCP